MNKEVGVLAVGEIHPAAHSAMDYIQKMITEDISASLLLLESFQSVSLSENRLAEICGETLRRIINGEPVSDRYLLGLSWTIKNMEDCKNAEIKNNNKNTGSDKTSNRGESDRKRYDKGISQLS